MALRANVEDEGSELDTQLRLHINGSLALCGTYPDEGLNRDLKRIAQCAHRSNWSLRVMHTWHFSSGDCAGPSEKKPRTV